MTLGERLKNIRKSLNLSQEAFGKKLHISKAGISAIENNRCNISCEVLKLLYKNYNINLNYIITGNGNMYNVSNKDDIKAEILEEVRKLFHKRGI